MEQYCIVPTVWGAVGLVGRGHRLAGTVLPQVDRAACEREICSRFPAAVSAPSLFKELQEAIRGYFAGERVAFDVVVDLGAVSAFQRAILVACRRIRFGRVCTYGELAGRAGHPGAARAVGTVMSNNRHPLIVPCHRVIAAGGRPGGYSGRQGVAFKLALLEHEGVALG